MHPVNKFLGRIGLQLSKTAGRSTSKARAQYEEDLEYCRKNAGPFKVIREAVFESGEHPLSFKDFECAFAANNLSSHPASQILDIGSYTHFLMGLSAAYKITTVDFRCRQPLCNNESVVVSDAKALNLPDCLYDAVVSLSTIEHIGLGRYGDDIDMEADKKAVTEMIRVLKPGGLLILSTTLTRAKPTIAFNAHRIYNREQVLELCHGLNLVGEQFIIKAQAKPCSLDNITTTPGEWDVYCGCWKKK